MTFRSARGDTALEIFVRVLFSTVIYYSVPASVANLDPGSGAF